VNRTPLIWTAERRREYEEVLRSSRTRAEAAKRLNTTTSGVDSAAETYGITIRDFLLRDRPLPSTVMVEVQHPPSQFQSVRDLLADRKKRFSHRHDHELAKKLIPVRVSEKRPIGLLVMGDPHIDDDGCNLPLLERHVSLVRSTPGLFAINAGDTTNNWTGRLARLYAQQGTTATEAWQLAEWLIKSVGKKWLFILGGNHDLWSGSGDPLIWISGQVGALYQPSAVRVALRFPGGLEVRINSRHDFQGTSQWNPAHGLMKAAQMGFRDHLFIAGHLHISAHGELKDPDSGINMQQVRVASYKVHDDYARDMGARDQHFSPCALITIDPGLPTTHPDLCKVFWDPDVGVEYLAALRRRRD
jgi:hypothetical protein